MKKTLPILFIILLSALQAKMINGIALIVDGEPVTTAEIRLVQQRAHVSKKQAIDLLIQDRLQKAAMKDIVIPEEEVDKEVSMIAAQNGLSVNKMQQLLQKQGIKWSKYRKTIRNGLKKRTFFKTKVAASIPLPTEDELKLFYQQHQKEFIIPKTINVTEYAAPTKAKLKAFLEGKRTKGIQSKRMTKKTKGMNAAMLGMLLQTPNGHYTAPINAGDKWFVYKIHAKNGKMKMPFKAAQNIVAARWRQQQQKKAIKDYFQKMKTEATIRYLRK